MHQGVPRAGQRSYWSLLSSLNHLSIRCEIPLHLAGRWGFETTSKQFYQQLDLGQYCPYYSRQGYWMYLGLKKNFNLLLTRFSKKCVF